MWLQFSHTSDPVNLIQVYYNTFPHKNKAKFNHIRHGGPTYFDIFCAFSLFSVELFQTVHLWIRLRCSELPRQIIFFRKHSKNRSRKARI